MDERAGVQPLDASAIWADALRREGRARTDALVRLRAHLAAAVKFEFDRRGIAVDGARTAESTALVRDAAETALAAILADLDRYRAQSAFTTWTAKYAIHAAASVAREKATAASSDGKARRG